MDTNFVVGDEVFLKSGGEKMTVEEIEDTSISCVWFDKSKKVERNIFPAATLKKAATPEERAAAIGAISRRLA